MNNIIFEKERFDGNFNGTTPPIDGEYFTIKRGLPCLLPWPLPSTG